MVVAGISGDYNGSSMDPGFRLLAAEYIGRQAKQLAVQFDGVRAAHDPAFVHRARVATRRLRASLRLVGVCFKQRKLGYWRKSLRRVTARLGAARDRDVQIDYLSSVLEAAPNRDCLPGIALLLVEIAKDRRLLQRKVLRTVDRIDAEGVIRAMRRAAKRIARNIRQSPPPVPGSDARAHVRRQIQKEISRLFCHEASLAQPQSRERHHAMRIAAKRLRYAIEIACGVFPGRLDAALNAMKRIQTLLGEIHDCDVWIERLDYFARVGRKRDKAAFGHAGGFARMQPGIDFLREDRGRRRDNVFRELVVYWGELKAGGFWADLQRTLAAPPLTTGPRSPQ
jgi:CHAD domain-containing protein